jgi:hypothetical protein
MLLDISLWWRGQTDLVVADFSFALLVVAVFALAAVPAYLRLEKGAGASISGRVVT